MAVPLLLPVPRQLSSQEGTLDLSALPRLIALHHDPAAPLFSAGKRLQAALTGYVGGEWEVAGGELPSAVSISLDAGLSKPESYHLSVTADGVRITGSDAAGAFYGVCTLIQLVQMHGASLPRLEITDWPDFPARGVMLDISRDKVPTMETLYALIDMLAGWKINQVQLYTEHTFAYRNHRTVWENASPITAEEILALDVYCKERFIELVPNQNSFGHMHRWLMHEKYTWLGETDVGITTPWGSKQEYPFSLSPAVPGTLPFLEELFAELLPNFTSRMFNIGADETFDLGAGRSKALVDEKGKGRVYLDFLLEIYQRVKAHGCTMQFWGDIINQYPDLVPELPKDVIALEWGYEANHDFPGKSALFAQSGIPFYVCPGTSSWVTIAGRTDNATGNIRSAVENGLKFGAIGVLNTDWGDLGHWQTLPVSYLGFAYGAALSWSNETNTDIDLPAVLSAFAFEDRSGVMGRLAYDLGNTYQMPGLLVHNSSLLSWIYIQQLSDIRARAARQNPNGTLDDDALAHKLHETIDYIDEVVTPLNSARMARPDAQLIQQEFAVAARMLKHGARRALAQLTNPADQSDLAEDLDGIEADLRQVWLSRNRPGGLDDSVTRLRRARAQYTGS